MGLFAPPASRPTSIIISTISKECLGDYVGNMSPGNINTGVPQTAQLAFYIPFYILEPVVVMKVVWQNGGVVAGNSDVGVYGADANLAPATQLVSSGATAQAGVSGLQEVDVTDTTLPGNAWYYLGWVPTDATTATYARFSMALGAVQAIGVLTQTGQTALPATATPADPGGAVTFLPVVGAVCRTIAA